MYDHDFQTDIDIDDGTGCITRPAIFSTWVSHDGDLPSLTLEGGYRGDIARLQSAKHIGGIADEELVANAHLLFAAPDMYAALLVAELASEELCQGQDPANECWVTLATIRAALAKARGEAE